MFSFRKKVRNLLKNIGLPFVLILGSDYNFIQKLFIYETKKLCGKTILYQDGFLTKNFPKFDFCMDYSFSNVISVLIKIIMNFIKEKEKLFAGDQLRMLLKK